MIKLRGKIETQDPINKIIFEPRAGFTRGERKTPELEFPLIYGHRCQFCNNVIQALFKAPRLFSLWPYEETVILSQGEKNAGEIRKIFPDDKAKYGKSCYRMDFNASEGGSVKITLKNHIMRHSCVKEHSYDGAGLWEVSEKVCIWAGIFSLREDLAIKDWLLFSQLGDGTRSDGDNEISKYKLPAIKDLILDTDTNFKLVPSVGVAPPVILVERQNFLYGFHYQTRKIMAPFKKG